jgi:hypothetical protein
MPSKWMSIDEAMDRRVVRALRRRFSSIQQRHDLRWYRRHCQLPQHFHGSTTILTMAQPRAPVWSIAGILGQLAASQEMQHKHDQPHDEHDMNQTAAYVKREEPKQPQDNQHHGNCRQHVFTFA